MKTERLTIPVTSDIAVSALALAPADPDACFVFAHGAGAGMTHPFMETVAAGLAKRRIATLRYQFPYMERGSRRTDAPALAHATVRAAVQRAHTHFGPLRLFAGGKSFGGRMTSQAQALDPLPDVQGLVFLGFPLHPAGKPSNIRAEHLTEIQVPLLFIQGTRDKLAEQDQLRPVRRRLGPQATVMEIRGADHGFGVLRRDGRSVEDAIEEVLDGVVVWISAWRLGV